jgi:hypothetical protein
MPTVDELLGPEPQKSVDDILGPPPEPPAPVGGTPEFDAWYAQTSNGRFLEAFGQGAKNGWGTESLGLSPETEDFLRKAGLFNDYESGQHNLIKSFNEALIRPAALLGETAFRALSAGFGAFQSGLSFIGEEVAKKNEAAGRPEVAASSRGAYELLTTLPEFMGAGFKQLSGVPNAPVVHPDIAKARTLGVIGEGEAGYAGTVERKPVDPDIAAAESLKADTEAASKTEPDVTSVSPEPVEPAPDINTIVRQANPQLFSEYDDLSARRDTFGRWMQELRDDAREKAAAPFEAEIIDLTARLEDATPRLAKKYQARLDDLTAQRDAAVADALRADNPDMARVRQAYQEADFRMRDLAPDVSAAYREAEARLGPTEETAPEVAPVARQAEEQSPAETPSEPVASAEPASEAPKATPEPQLTVDEGTAKAEPPPAEPSAPTVQPPEAPPAEQTAQPKYVAEISNDVTKKLVAAGRPEEEARAASQVIASYYETRAARFGGQRGTAADLYNAEAPEIRVRHTRARAKEMAQRRAGSIRIGEGHKVITLFKDADASTFIHETGHQFLEDLLADAEHPLAPADLKADAQTVREWLGVKDGEAIKTRQHEKFARGFERYMMEGVAPSKALARVFAQFRDWLTRIYQTVKNLKAPINDDIRSVFDRMLSQRPERTVIAPEKSAPTIGDIHMSEADRAPPEEAQTVRETIRQEADEYARTHVPEVADELGIRERPNPEGDQGQGRQADRNGAEGQPEPAANGGGQESGSVGAGGGETPSEGTRPSKPTEPPAGPNERFAEPESRLVDKAGNIRLDNLGTPEDINAVIREAAAQNDDFLSARRGVISDAQVLDLADALGMSPETLSVRKLGEAFNAEQIMAARKLLVQSATRVRDAMAKAASGSDADVMAYAEAKARHQMIQEQVAGITAEAGRALRAFRSIEGIKDAQQLGDFLQQNTGKTLFQLKREAQLGMSLDTPQKVSKFINDTKKPKFSDMVIEAWINALLSGPLTHIKNTIGNMAVAVGSVVETGGAATVGTVRRALTGADDGVRFGEAKSRLFGLAQGSIEGVRAAAEAFKNEESMTGTLANEQRKYQAIPGMTGKVIRVPTRLLGAEDEFFKAIAERQEINALAYRMATEEGLVGEAFNARVTSLSMNPTEAMLEEARKNAVYQTFQKQLGPTGRAIQQFANSHPLAKIVVPFIRTPTNLIKYAGERTPLGLFSQEVRANLSGVNGAAARDTQIARMAMGTAVGVSVMALAAQGLITGGGPSDPKERATLRLTGWQPYSLKIGDGYYSYAWLDPFSTVMGISADMYDVAKAGTQDDADMGKVAAMFFGSVTKNIMGKLSLRGASDLIQALTDPDRYGPRYIQSLAGTLVPSVIAQMAREMDPLERDARTTLDSLKARIPGLRQTLLPRRDVWGEPISNPENLGPDMLSPIAESPVNTDPVNQALLRLRYFPSRPGRTIRGVELTDQQYDDYARIAGRLAKVRLDAIVNGPGFSSMPDNIQRDLLASTVDHAREAARTLIMIQNPTIVQAAMDAKTKPLRTGEIRSKGPIKQPTQP